MPRAKKEKKTAAAKPDTAQSIDAGLVSTFTGPPPSYPLSPTEIEIILHIRWNGNGFERSERAGKNAVQLTGEDLQAHAKQIPFDPDRRKIENRTVEYDITSEDDFSAMLHRAHRIQLVTSDGELPELFTDDGWISGRKGVQKPDGIGILLSRPML